MDTSGWSDLRRQRAADAAAIQAARLRLVNASAHPAELARSCDPDYVITPAIDLISRKVEAALCGRRRRLMVTMGPQEGKSRLCAVWTPLRALQKNPNWRIMLLTYADGLAEEHSRAARSFIQEYGSGVVDRLTGHPLPDRLGLSLHPDKATATDWRIQQGDGGLVAAGRDATITGKRADLLIVDDPFKNMQEADSAALRAKVLDWYRSVATTRLAPGASVIFINTRWHPEDLSGHLLQHDRELPPELREWHYVNIPAISHPAIPDALNREPGIALESARGRTADDFAAIRRSVGERVWNALYQGVPTPPEGGLFNATWFDGPRLPELPPHTMVRVVAVDPSESGHGDEAGVIGAALLYPPAGWAEREQQRREAYIAAKLMAPPDTVVPEPPPEPYTQIALTHDRSAQMTSDQWATAAVDLALETDASDIVVEAYTAGDTYTNVVRRVISGRLRHVTDPVVRAKLTTLSQRVRKWRGTGDAVARSAMLRQAVEVGTCAVVGHDLSEMEMQARLWQVGQHQPDRVAAAVIAHSHLATMAARTAAVGKPTGGRGDGPNAAWLSRKVG